MKPQEQNKPKTPYQNQPSNSPGMQKSTYSKQPGVQDKNRKGAEFDKSEDKDADECGSPKGSCHTK